MIVDAPHLRLPDAGPGTKSNFPVPVTKTLRNGYAIDAYLAAVFPNDRHGRLSVCATSTAVVHSRSLLLRAFSLDGL